MEKWKYEFGTALRPVQRKIRPKTMRRIGQDASSSTGQLMESSTSASGARGCSAINSTPPLQMFTRGMRYA